MSSWAIGTVTMACCHPQSTNGQQAETNSYLLTLELQPWGRLHLWQDLEATKVLSGNIGWRVPSLHSHSAYLLQPTRIPQKSAYRLVCSPSFVTAAPRTPYLPLRAVGLLLAVQQDCIYLHSFLKDFICLKERESTCAHILTQAGGGAEGQPDSPLSAEPVMVLDPRTLRS